MAQVTLTEFLLARIAEDEAAARAVTPGPWRIEKSSSHMDRETWAVADIERFREYTNHVSCGEDKALAEYISLHHPAHVLAECAAKRRIVGQTQSAKEAAKHALMDFEDGYAMAHNNILELLALPYAYHEDYQQEWKP